MDFRLLQSENLRLDGAMGFKYLLQSEKVRLQPLNEEESRFLVAAIGESPVRRGNGTQVSTPIGESPVTAIKREGKWLLGCCNRRISVRRGDGTQVYTPIGESPVTAINEEKVVELTEEINFELIDDFPPSYP